MQKLTILIDLDDTVEHLLCAWVAWLNEKHDTNVKLEDVTQWNLGVVFPSLTEEQIHAPLEEERFWETVQPMEGAAETIKWMLSQGHEVYIVTASAYRTIRPKMEQVLFKYFPFLTWDNVIITTHKQMIDGDVLIDDAPHNLLGGKYVKILMDAPHNQTFNAEANGMCRVKNWDEVKSAIEGVWIDYKISKEVQRIAHKSRENPEWFVEEYFGAKLTPVQKIILRIKSRMLGF